jgi:hypothetical protein
MAPEQDPQAEEAGGCFAAASSLGLAAYALLVISMGAAGVICGSATLCNALRQTIEPESRLSSGINLQPWRIEELRREGLLGADQVPQLYMDDSFKMDGSSGCVVVEGSLTRWRSGETSTVLVSGATVESRGSPQTPTIVVSRDEVEIDCPFLDGDQGQRFYGMLLAESRLTRPD